MALQVVEFQDPRHKIQKNLVSVMKASCFYEIGIFDIFWNGMMASLVQNLGLNKLFFYKINLWVYETLTNIVHMVKKKSTQDFESGHFSLKTFQVLKSKVCLILNSRIQNFISDIAITFDAEFWNVAMKLFSTK